MSDMVKLEEMAAFFEKRLAGYDAHMRRDIEGGSDFYAYTAARLPRARTAEVLDLGCGTGLELEEYFALNPDASVTGIDLCGPMLDALAAKFPHRRLKLIRGSYFDADLPKDTYDAAVSVESLHHFPAERKRKLYKKLFSSLKENGYFVLTDYYAESEELEKEYFQNLEALKREQGLDDGAFYHYDTPLTAEHEMAVLREAGFAEVRVLRRWGSTCTVYAGKRKGMIREAERADLAACAGVIRESFRTVAEEFGITRENAPRFTAFAVSEEKLIRQMEEEHRRMYLNEEDGVICGFYSLRLLEDGACELGNLSVLPAYRHRGIGNALLNHAMETAKRQHLSVMKLSIVEENVRLRAWYERHGAVHTGTEQFGFFPFACGYLSISL